MHRNALPTPALLIAGLLACGAAAAQQSSAVYPTPQGEVVVHTGQPGPRDFGPPPPFEQLDRAGLGAIGADEADAYPPLANDFIHADGNRDGRVSRREYQHWSQNR